MTAYMIISVTPEDADKMSQYEEQTLPIVARHGGRPLARDTDVLGIDTDGVPDIGVILEFPSKQAVLDFYASPDYEPLKQFRRSFAWASAMVIEG